MDRVTMSTAPINWTAVVRDLDDEALDELAKRLAPRLRPQIAQTPTVGRRDEAGLRLTVAEVATATRLHPQTVYRHLRSGRLQGDRAGTRWLIAPEALDEFLSSGPAPETPGRMAPRAVRPTSNRPGPLRALLDAEKKGG
jgi:excisionase family DNA binding protein